MKSLCVICKQTDAKYKCPTCISPYCSVECCKKHKETPCTFVERVKPTQPLNKFKYRPKDKKKDAPIKKKIIISKSTLSHLKRDAKIREILQDSKIQKVIQDILIEPKEEINEEDLESIRLQEIRKILENNADFSEFANICYQSIGIRDSKGHSIL